MRRLLLASVAASALAVPDAQAQVLTSDIPMTIRIMQGFTQTSNYLKGLMFGIQRTTDASNTANARFQRDVRNAQIRDEHVPTPVACESLDNAQSIVVANGQSWVVRESLSAVTDPRGEAQPGTPSWTGQGHGMAANAARHLRFYCSAAEAAEGICGETPMPNWDQRASVLLGPLTYGPAQERVDAAVDYTATIAQNVALAHPRGDQLASAQGTEIMAARRWYNAAKSMARHVYNDMIARRVETVVLAAAQREQQRALGMTPTERGSWMLATELDVLWRAAPTYAAALQKMPPGSRLTETLQAQGAQTMILWETHKLVERQTALLAALLANEADKPLGLRDQALRLLTAAPTPQAR